MLLVSLSIFSCSGKERILEIELPPTLVLEQNINFFSSNYIFTFKLRN